MGDPVKIKDLARRLIQMSGLRPEIDIPIQITGLRPGEKLHEKLWSDSAKVYTNSLSPGIECASGTAAVQTSPLIWSAWNSRLTRVMILSPDGR